MKLEHHFTVPATTDTVWASLDDLAALVPCVPGAALTASEGDTFEGTVKVKLGPISMVYAGKGTFLERDKDAGRVVVEAKGKDKRGNGTAGATVTAQLTADGESTVVDLSTDLAVTGKPAQFGRGVIQDVSDKLLGQFVERFTQQLQGGAVEGGAGPDQAAAGTAAGVAAGAADAGGSAGSAPQADDAGSDAAAAGAADSVKPAGAPAPEASAPPRPRPTAPPEPEEAELDLLSSVMPVLLKRAVVPVLVVTAFLVGFLIGRTRRH